MRQQSINSSEFLAVAHRLADASGGIIRRAFRSSLTVSDKADCSPVTAIDREAEQAMRGILEKAFPRHGVIGEEFGAFNPRAEHVWILDPVDGTRGFVCGKLAFVSLIALMRGGEFILGVIDQPVLGDRWVGFKGNPTLFNGKACRTRPCSSLGEAIAIVAPNRLFEDESPNLAPFRRVAQASKTYSIGTDCNGFGLVAAGLCDLVLEDDHKLYDFAALVPVLEGAGGLITDWWGQRLHQDYEGGVLAAGDRRVGQEVARLLRPSP